MAQPVWVLSVDLQTKTATFTSGLADAAKGARTSFQDIKSGANDMGRSVGGSAMEARHGVMLLGEEFGVHLPRALTTFIASIGPVGAAMEAAFPFLAVLVGATLLIQHLSKLKDAGHELTESQMSFGTVATNVLNGLSDKLLQAGIRADELNHNHIDALKKQIELIDHQSMNELVSSFNEVSKAADGVLTKLDTHWYSFDAGSKKAKESLDDFRVHYDQLLAAHNETGAADFLAETLKSQQKIVDLQKQANDNQFKTGQKGQHTDYGKYEEAKNALKAVGWTWDNKEIQSAQELLQVYKDQVANQKALADTKSLDVKNAKTEDADKEAAKQAQKTADIQKGFDERLHIEGAAHQKHAEMLAAEVAEEQQASNLKFAADRSFSEAVRKMDEERAKRADAGGREEAEHESKMAQLVLAGKKEHAQSLMAQGRATAQELIDLDRQAEMQSFQSQTDALQKELAALDHHDADVVNKEQALNNKLAELKQQHDNKMQGLEDQSARKELSALDSWTARMRSDFASGFSQVIMGKQSFAQMMQKIDSQMMESGLKFALSGLEQMATVQGRARLGDARQAAADAWRDAGNPILGAVVAASTFASVMALQDGGVVPGVGTGDIVPAMLEPGEGVLSNRVMDRLSNMSKFGNDNAGPEVHVHHHATYHVQAFNADGVDQVLREHGGKFVDHAAQALRKMNR